MERTPAGTSHSKPTRMDIFNIWSESKGSRSDRLQSIQKKVLLLFNIGEQAQDTEEKQVKDICRHLCDQLFLKWEKSHRMRQRFLDENADWLNMEVEVTNSEKEIAPKSSVASRGRPKKLFEESSDRSKRRKVKDLRSAYGESHLVAATEMTLKQSAKKDAAKLLKEATLTTPKRASRIRSAWSNTINEARKQTPYTNEGALSLIVENNLTKHQYINLRKGAKDRNCNIYPNYNKVLLSKKRCYPPDDDTIISESMIEVKLQAILDHTARRLISSQEEVLGRFSSSELGNLFLISKWGFDGSTGHSEYKQRMSEMFSDSDLFITSFVPIQMYSLRSSSSSSQEDKKMLWQNPRPSSTRYCRPIRIQFKKESSELSRHEAHYIDSQIKNLMPTVIYNNIDTISIKHNMVLTMVDGKVCNAVTSTTSAQVCYICGARPKEMNNVEKVAKKQVDTSSFRFGLSTLHSWIRFFEYVLHVSYRLEIKKWQVRGEDKNKFKLRKELIQGKFKSEMGLIIDKVKPGGSGTSNDGNTARRFFQNPEISSSIVDIEESLIRRCAVILHVISSGFSVNTSAFDSYAFETARLLVNTYPWFYLPASMHKILFHGSAIIEAALLPIGQLSEEAQESRNKDLKRFPENYTRKMSRKGTNQELLNRLLVTSDPVITSLRPLPPNKKHKLFPEVIQLLLPSEAGRECSSSEENLSGDEDNYSYSSSSTSY